MPIFSPQVFKAFIIMSIQLDGKGVVVDKGGKLESMGYIFDENQYRLGNIELIYTAFVLTTSRISRQQRD